MPTVTIAHLRIETVTVRLPDTCPHCKRPLGEVALTGYEYQDQSRAVAVQPSGSDLVVDWDEESNNIPDSGESYISWCQINCQCGQSLAVGNEERIDRTAEPAVYSCAECGKVGSALCMRCAEQKGKTNA